MYRGFGGVTIVCHYRVHYTRTVTQVKSVLTLLTIVEDGNHLVSAYCTVIYSVRKETEPRSTAVSIYGFWKFMSIIIDKYKLQR